MTPEEKRSDPTDPSHDDGRGRKQIHVKVCASSRDGWDVYVRKQGVTLAALIDAMGHMLATRADGMDASVELAREIDANRRRR